MNDYTELKRLAESAVGKSYMSAEKFFFSAEASPERIKALIAENERLSKSVESLIQMERATGNRAIEYAGKCDQLKAENEALRNAFRPLLAHWDDLKAGESLNVDAARAAMGKGGQS
ncbi:MAG: hypothetical protein MUW57_21965 [Pseudomonas sp.]|nr:hypothetical protein [Pseudomonas sp.]